MASRELLIAVLLTEAAVLAVGLTILLGHAAVRRTLGAWRRPRVRATKTALVQALAGDDASQPLPRLPLEEAVGVFADATRSVDVGARRRLAVSADYTRLVARAGRWCHSRRWPRRLKGARLLNVLGAGEDAVPPLLDDPRAEVRCEAAAWVAQHPTSPRLARLVEMLDDHALSCRLVAQATLIRLERRAIQPLIHELHNLGPTALAPALLVAARLGDPALRGPALTQRAHPDPAVRAAVAKVLTALGGDTAVDALARFLTDPDPDVRAAATEGLGTLGHWPSAPALADRLGDTAWPVRRAAGLALRHLDAPGRFYLQRALQAPDPFAVDMARQALDLPERIAREPQRR